MKELGTVDSFTVTGAMVNLDITSKEVTLEGDDSIIGKAIAIREENGNAAGKEACCLVEELDYECTWTRSDFYDTTSAKKAVSAALFLLFVGYTALTFLRQNKKTSGDVSKFSNNYFLSLF